MSLRSTIHREKTRIFLCAVSKSVMNNAFILLEKIFETENVYKTYEANETYASLALQLVDSHAISRVDPHVAYNNRLTLPNACNA